MKKCLFLITLFASVSAALQAQTFAEWFKQKKTQTKYSLAQVVALQGYAGVLRKGYNIAKDGLGIINSIKSGDFRQHSEYYSSLRNVSPKVKSDGAYITTVMLQLRFMEVYKRIKSDALGSEWLSASDKFYTQRVLDGALSKCSENAEMLSSLSADGQLQLTDDERMQRIHAVKDEMQDLYVFIQHFAGNVRVLMANRKTEIMESRKLQKLTGVSR
ncbi:hypothetical protein [Filimonas effusa]|uniref:TerB family tellurite resistance protein n=1 Tax=Filimonas effusa TaxID=2508721 RepID=A0A4Q1D1X3_9BACT|nr:hypothetical protein [Filimonas effusa]RXK81290.1 hypothetical protein ESB13_20350 [Filimonas effusa]